MKRLFPMQLAGLTLALLLAAPLNASAQEGGGGTPPVAPPASTQNAKDVEAALFLKELKPKLGKEADQDAKISIKRLVAVWKDKEVTDETKKPVPDYLERYAREDKTIVSMDAIDGLGDLGPAAGAGPVLSILEHELKAKEPSVDVYGSCLRAMQKLADTKKTTVKALQDLLKHKMDDVVAKAADAIAGYKDAPGKIRRDLLEELIKSSEGTASQAGDAGNAGQVRKWNIIQGSVMKALNALSGQKFKDPAEARKWFNDHKKDKSWDT